MRNKDKNCDSLNVMFHETSRDKVGFALSMTGWISIPDINKKPWWELTYGSSDKTWQTMIYVEIDKL